MRVLLTNDDGVHAPGIQILAKELSRYHDVTLVAPAGEASGSGAGVGPVYDMVGGIKVEPVELNGLSKVKAYSVEALPALAVLMVCLGGFGEVPEVVVSGINKGLNTGRSVLHSGTVGAALTAQHFSIRSIAISIAWEELPRFETAARICSNILQFIEHFPPQTVFNVNVPSLELQEIKGVKFTKLSRSGLIKGGKIISSESESERRFRLNLDPEDNAPSDTDASAVQHGYVSVTPLQGVTEAYHYIDSDKLTLLTNSLLNE